MRFFFRTDDDEAGDANRRPLLIGQGLGATVCRVAMPATATGTIAPARGITVHAAHFSKDPRWSRPLPWVARLKGFFGPGAMLASAGLALVNVALPLLILLLVAGRRRFSVAALMALPIAAAIPLMALLVLKPMRGSLGSSANFPTIPEAKTLRSCVQWRAFGPATHRGLQRSRVSISGNFRMVCAGAKRSG